MPASPPKELTAFLNIPAPSRRQSLYVVCTTWQRPVFLINSSQSRFSAPSVGIATNGRGPLSRTYGDKLPSSLRTVLSSAVRILSSPTCVSFGTDPHAVPGRLFSVTHPCTSATNRPRRSRGTLCSRSGLHFRMTSPPVQPTYGVQEY